ncbi:MAG: hypothetical protein HUU46_22485 [Candidatus Hydrogenedentes bacterium]|nr:hypothetical protein [Candidatus Hydrogenedentota bacterium]
MRTTRVQSSRETEAAELESKSFGFGVGMLGLAQFLKGKLPDPVVNALAEHGTHVGAHVLDAHSSASGQLSSYASARQAVRQATYWLRLVHASDPTFGAKLDPLIRDAADLASALKAAATRARQAVAAAKVKGA